MGPPCTHLNLPSKAPKIYILKKNGPKALCNFIQDIRLELQPLQVPYSITKVFLVGIEKAISIVISISYPSIIFNGS
jgi:hypothetical protein